ncbi:23002_t:CDS:10 [Entrophospora sp. SA101]|nr:13846_t:CDS:10 [Entrophospora sp. SA101]CAJ0644387.1 11204_t:CDS:10 [Entrophospora sp. SA101]CAJ0753377.1 23002_t:CDS:10 [Entrophospora sp. SA101]CAJ0841653.1 10792_t:CDS:10 [Entrophospora sp. SA101]CAJ0899734.1 6060_t:CDS:10 [Entrophospora sp. SA101]
MPPLPVNVTTLPTVFINAILENEQKINNDPNSLITKNNDQDQDLLNSFNADREKIFACIQRIEDKIKSLKKDVLKTILIRKDKFAKLYNNSITFRDRIDNLFLEVDEVHKKIHSSENGLKPKLLMALHQLHTITQELQNTASLVDVLNYLNEIQILMNKVQEYMKQGRIEEAAGSINEMDRLLESPPIKTERQVYIFDKLKTQSSIMKETLDQNLDDFLNHAISFKKYEDKEEIVLTVLSSIENENFTILLTSIFVSLTEIDSINMQLSRLKKNVMKYLISPLMKNKDSWKVSTKIEDDDTTAKLIIDKIFILLISIFKFIYTFIFGGLDPMSKRTTILPVANGYASTFGKFISHDLRDVVINEYLSNVIPTETSEFKRFEKVASSVKEFQNEMRKMGFMRQLHSNSDEEDEDERTLGAYVAKVDIHFTVKKRDKMLESGREIILDGDFDSIIVDNEGEKALGLEDKEDKEDIVDKNETLDKKQTPADNQQKQKQDETIFNDEPTEGWDVDWNETWNEDDANGVNSDNLVKEPEKIIDRYSITKKSKLLIDLTISTLKEAQKLNSKSGVRLFQATLDLFDLYCAIMPIYYHDKLSEVPALTMLFRNDCIWLADQLLDIQEQYNNNEKQFILDPLNTFNATKTNIFYNKMVNKLCGLGKEWYDLQLDKQKSGLKEILDEMGGFAQSATDEKFEACQRGMNQVVHTINHLSKILDGVLRPIELYSVLGELIDYVLMQVIDNIEDLYDISAEESEQLNKICVMLYQLEKLFKSTEPYKITNHVENWIKFKHITDILTISLAEIMKRFHSGYLRSFSIDELEGLVCALFADSTLRENSLSEIREGHPI